MPGVSSTKVGKRWKTYPRIEGPQPATWNPIFLGILLFMLSFLLEAAAAYLNWLLYIIYMYFKTASLVMETASFSGYQVIEKTHNAFDCVNIQMA